MKREIKFRAWYEGKMYEVFSTNMTMVSITLMRFPFTQDVIPDAIMQYTGLKDKNGKKIYEGDIIEIELRPEKAKSYKALQKIKWEIYQDNEYGNWISGFNIDYNRYGVDAEIVGNIYENPELL